MYLWGCVGGGVGWVREGGWRAAWGERGRGCGRRLAALEQPVSTSGAAAASTKGLRPEHPMLQVKVVLSAPAPGATHLLRSKCQIHQWPTEAHSLRGVPRNSLNMLRCVGDHLAISVGITGCHAVSSTSLRQAAEGWGAVRGEGLPSRGAVTHGALACAARPAGGERHPM